jgi:hypothetical protein
MRSTWTDSGYSDCDYDAWKLQTPEEYNGYTEKNCVQCGDLYDAPASDESKLCSYCMEENQEAEEDELHQTAS